MNTPTRRGFLGMLGALAGAVGLGRLVKAEPIVSETVHESLNLTPAGVRYFKNLREKFPRPNLNDCPPDFYIVTGSKDVTVNLPAASPSQSIFIKNNGTGMVKIVPPPVV